MDKKHLIVVSAENNAYMAWQCKLFHFSCVSRLEQTPVFIAHETGADLDAGFKDIVRVGGDVRSAPSYKLTAHGDSYPPRNTPGSLVHAAVMCDSHRELIVLCDPDMIFVRKPEFALTLSGDFCSYMNYDRENVESARARLGIPRELIVEQKDALRCGVPYSIPVTDALRLGEEWIKAVDAFPPRKQEDVMHAFGLAAIGLGLKIELTRMAETNYWPDAILKADVVHYCYGDATWNKRHFFREEDAPRVWQSTLEAPAGTVLYEILTQIHEADEFYSSL